jgi:hypothetical protein
MINDGEIAVTDHGHPSLDGKVAGEALAYVSPSSSGRWVTAPRGG